MPGAWNPLASASFFTIIEPLCLAVGKADTFMDMRLQINQDKGPLSQKAKESEFLPMGVSGEIASENFILGVSIPLGISCKLSFQSIV